MTAGARRARRWSSGVAGPSGPSDGRRRRFAAARRLSRRYGPSGPVRGSVDGFRGPVNGRPAGRTQRSGLDRFTGSGVVSPPLPRARPARSESAARITVVQGELCLRLSMLIERARPSPLSPKVSRPCDSRALPNLGKLTLWVCEDFAANFVHVSAWSSASADLRSTNSGNAWATGSTKLCPRRSAESAATPTPRSAKFSRREPPSMVVSTPSRPRPGAASIDMSSTCTTTRRIANVVPSVSGSRYLATVPPTSTFLAVAPLDGDLDDYSR
jgi:hypothetical protein